MGLFGKSRQDDASTNEVHSNRLVTESNIICTGLSGNEIYCAAMAGYSPGHILVGNSVDSLGTIGEMASGIHTSFGGEVPQHTKTISEGRRLALQRFEQEMQQANAVGATGVTSEVIFRAGTIEFLSIGSSLYTNGAPAVNGAMTTAADAQELFCQLDAGYTPLRLAFGNVAYSIGLGGNLLASLRQLAHGEVKEYSDIFSTTRNLALSRIIDDARRYNANSIVGIRTNILSVGKKGLQEMMMLGTASYHPQLAEMAAQVGGVITSDLTAQELWNMTKLGYAPVQLVLGTSVYSLGVVGGIKAALRSIAKGEVNSLTEMVYGARQQSLKKVQDQAAAAGADMVIGIKTYIYQLSNELIEFLAVGTAVKRIDGLATRSEQLPPQAIINDKDTFIDMTRQAIDVDMTNSSQRTGTIENSSSSSEPTKTAV